MYREKQVKRIAVILALGVAALVATPGSRAQCGPGPHWVDACWAGIDNMNILPIPFTGNKRRLRSHPQLLPQHRNRFIICRDVVATYT